MKTPIQRPDRPEPPPRRLTLEEACWRGGLSYTPEVWTPERFGEVFLRLLVAGISHEWTGTPLWFKAVLFYAPRDPLGRVVTAPPRQRRRRGPRT